MSFNLSEYLLNDSDPIRTNSSGQALGYVLQPSSGCATNMSVTDSISQAHKIPFGVRNGQMVHVEEVFNGKDCGCLCAECEAPLVASNREPRKVVKYFRHHRGAECPGGLETAIHRAAKEVLLRRRVVTLPAQQRIQGLTATDGRVFSETVFMPALQVTATEAYEEVWQEDMRPDVLFTVNGESIYIEILVSHAVDEAKQKKIRQRQIQAIEINLSRLVPADIRDMHRFEEVVLHQKSLRHWLCWPEFETLSATAMARVRAEVEAYEAKLLAQEEKRRQQAEAESLKRQAEAEERRRINAEKAVFDRQRRQAMRDKFAVEIAALYQFQRPEVVENWNALQQPHCRYDSGLVKILTATQREFLLSRVAGYWIFEARYQDWQSFILDELFPATPRNTGHTLKSLKAAVTGRFKVMDWVSTINGLEYARKTQPDSDRGFVLYTTEVGMAPDAYTVVSN